MTATKIYINVAMPDQAGGRRPRRSTSVTAPNWILEDALQNPHPRDLIAHGEQDSLVESLVTAVTGRLPRSPRPVECINGLECTTTSSATWGGSGNEPSATQPIGWAAPGTSVI